MPLYLFILQKGDIILWKRTKLEKIIDSGKRKEPTRLVYVKQLHHSLIQTEMMITVMVQAALRGQTKGTVGKQCPEVMRYMILS